MKIQKKSGVEVSGGRVRLGGQGGCERRIEVIVIMQNKNPRGGGGIVKSSQILFSINPY